MAAALRQLLQRTGSIPVASPAMLLLVRCYSTEPTAASSSNYCFSTVSSKPSTTSTPTQPAAASSKEYRFSNVSTKPGTTSSEEYCYALGANGKMRFNRKHFIPFDQYLMENENSILEPVPMDRLIAPPDVKNYNFFTSYSAKQFIRSGYLAAYFAKKLKLSIPAAFADGNVGVISGLNILAFLKLDTELSTELSGASNDCPLTFSGFSSFLQAKMIQIYHSKAYRMSDGLEELMKLSHDSEVSELMVIYHPEFLSLEALASIYIEAHRITRKEMPSTGEDHEAYNLIVHLNSKLGKSGINLCDSNPILVGWLGQQAKSGIAGAFGLSVPPGTELNLKLLRKADRKKLQELTRIAYGMSPPSAKSPKTPPIPPVYPKDPIVPTKFKESKVIDVHRHCMVHLVQDDTMATFFQVLPEDNVTSLRKKKPSWRDGVYLLLHNFGSYPHYVAESFEKFDIWDRLDLKTRCPIPEIFFAPPFSHVDVEGNVKADVRR